MSRLSQPKYVLIVLGAVIAVALVLRVYRWLSPPALELSQESVGIQTITSTLYRVTFSIPSTWEPDTQSLFNGEFTRYSGGDGFMSIDAMSSTTLNALDTVTIDGVALSLTNIQLQHIGESARAFGSSPSVTSGMVDGHDARFILPSPDQPKEQKGEAALVVAYPAPISINGQAYEYLVVYVDARHLFEIAQTLQLLAD